MKTQERKIAPQILIMITITKSSPATMMPIAHPSTVDDGRSESLLKTAHPPNGDAMIQWAIGIGRSAATGESLLLQSDAGKEEMATKENITAT
jgi:hypothetical protein